MNGLLPDIFKLVFGCIWLYLVTSGCIVAADGEDRPATVLNGVSNHQCYHPYHRLRRPQRAAPLR